MWWALNKFYRVAEALNLNTMGIMWSSKGIITDVDEEHLMDFTTMMNLLQNYHPRLLISENGLTTV